MNDQTTPRRRSTSSVLGLAVLIGALAALPISVLVVVAVTSVQELLEGVGPGMVWRDTLRLTDDDLEMVDIVLVSAGLFGMVIGAVSAAIWLTVTNRVPGRPEVARRSAGFAAAGVPLLSLWMSSWPTALAVALLAGLIAYALVPRIGYDRRRMAWPVGS